MQNGGAANYYLATCLHPREPDLRLINAAAEVTVVEINIVGSIRVHLGHQSLEPSVVLPLGHDTTALLISPIETLHKYSSWERFQLFAVKMLDIDCAIVFDFCNDRKDPQIVTILVDNF